MQWRFSGVGCLIVEYNAVPKPTGVFQSVPVDGILVPTRSRGWCSVMKKSSTSQSNPTCWYKQNSSICSCTEILRHSNKLRSLCRWSQYFMRHGAHQYVSDASLFLQQGVRSVAEKRLGPGLAYRGRSSSFRPVIFLRENRLGSRGAESAYLWLEYQFECFSPAVLVLALPYLSREIRWLIHSSYELCVGSKLV
jgi:hypothetical protein